MNKLKICRKESGYTIRELSSKSGIAFSYISELENGSKKNPTKETMDKIALALKKTVPEVFY